MTCDSMYSMVDDISLHKFYGNNYNIVTTLYGLSHYLRVLVSCIVLLRIYCTHMQDECHQFPDCLARHSDMFKYMYRVIM